jgi:UDP-2,4-diacetamido-2,4,6-trideoxy-beta-L-altropyranose hydrolase
MVLNGKTLISSSMQIIFRTDASIQIGIGHVMRCLTLADALHEAGANCTFVCRSHTGHLLELIQKRGHRAIGLATENLSLNNPQAKVPRHASWLGTDWVTDVSDTLQALVGISADWLIVDHYALDVRWEKAMRSHCKKLMVIDDLADRMHDCDLLLDQNLGLTREAYYPLIPRTAEILIGPHFALLRPEFESRREESMARRNNPKLQHILITMGGVDKNNATEQVLSALCISNLPIDTRITVVLGPHSPWQLEVKARATQMPWTTNVLINVENMADLMTQSDLAIGASGSTNWERCCLGLPSLLVVQAENQKSSAKALEDSGIAYILDLESLRFCLPEKINQLRSGNTLRIMSDAALPLCKGAGSAILVDHLLKHP